MITFILDIWTFGMAEAWERYWETPKQREERIAANFAGQMGISYQEALMYLRSRRVEEVLK